VFQLSIYNYNHNYLKNAIIDYNYQYNITDGSTLPILILVPFPTFTITIYNVCQCTHNKNYNIMY